MRNNNPLNSVSSHVGGLKTDRDKLLFLKPRLIVDPVGWTNTKHGNRVLSLWRQRAYDYRCLMTSPDYLHLPWWKRIFKSQRELHRLRMENIKLRQLISEKTGKLADSDALVAELSKARDGLYKTAKDRKKIIDRLESELQKYQPVHGGLNS